MANLTKLEEHLLTRSYVEGHEPSQADVIVYKAIKSAPTTTNASRWYHHIKSYEDEFHELPGSSEGGQAFLGSEKAAAAGGDDDDDEIDLFGSDDEADEEAERLKAERVKAYEEKKAKKPKTIAKSVVTMDVKPWDDETDMAKVVEAAERWAVSEMTASPPVVIGMAKERCDLEALERVVCGGAPLPTTAAEMFRRRFPNVDLCMGYGSTEAGGISLMIDREECTRIGSAGRVSENVEVKIVDHITGKPLSVGQRGELFVRGPAVMTGYVGDDEANASTFDSEGWLKTGDLCYVDQDGFLFVVDRLKELIKYKGYQVPPAELELVLQTLPEVVEAAVMPYPDEEAGQIPIALVVRQPGSKVTEAQVMDHVAKRVASYKKIRKVLFVDSIPKSPAGKILRRQLTNYLQFGAVSRL